MSNKPIKAKSRKGVVSLFLRDSTGVKPDRKFVLRPNTTTPIPADYAQGMLNSVSVQRHIKTGLIIIEDGKELEEKAVEEGYATEKSLEKIDRDAITETLKGNNLTKIKALFDKEKPEEASVALEIAREIADELSSGVIRTIENTTKSSIQAEEV